MKNFFTKIISITLLFGIIFLLTQLLYGVNFPTLNQNAVKNNSVPDKRTCGTMDRLELTLKENPDYRNYLDNLEKYTQEYIKNHKLENINTVVTIPVVVHVVYNSNIENISYDQVRSQLNILSNDYRRWNSDSINTPSCFKPVSADAQVLYKLAGRDPNGNPTLGITRTYTTVTEFGLDDAVKFTSRGGEDAWNRNVYLNIWVCNLGSNLLGYAQFPGGPAVTDGVVILYSAFGNTGIVAPPYDKGRTATHEVGHWLWLYHIWGDDNGACTGSDYVDDTPNQGSENYGCPAFPHVSCDNGPNGDMFMNYMDYTDDGCMNIFTQGQTVRMWSALNGPRLPILTSIGGNPVSGQPICEFYSDSTTINLGGSVHFYDATAGIPTSWNWSITGPSSFSSSEQNPTFSFNTPGFYNVKLRASNSFGADSIIKSSYIKVRGPYMSAFSLVSPPSFTRIDVSPVNQEYVNFIWNKTSNNSLIHYKWTIKKIGLPNELAFFSNNNGLDSIISLRKSFLDTLADNFGTNGDSVSCVWRTWAYNGVDSLNSNNSFIVTFVRVPIGIRQISSNIPSSYNLYPNYPNPFNPSTHFKFDLPKKENVKLTIYDILGRGVAVLVNGEFQPGTYQISWDASEYASGLYFFRMETKSYSLTRKLILLK